MRLHELLDAVSVGGKYLRRAAWPKDDRLSLDHLGFWYYEAEQDELHENYGLKAADVFATDWSIVE